MAVNMAQWLHGAGLRPVGDFKYLYFLVDVISVFPLAGKDKRKK